jgi:lipoprotein-releasing system ATP-binding protein
MGPSGCGKSTLLNVLGTLDRPDSGTLSIDGKDVSSLGDKSLSRLRNETIGFVFQFHHLLPEFTILENLMIPLMLAGREVLEAHKISEEWLSRVDLSERQDHRPTSISGGERQRVAVLRALVNKPKLVLADEPTGNLDVTAGENLMKVMSDLVSNEKCGFIIATHNPKIAEIADRTLYLNEGILSSS